MKGFLALVAAAIALIALPATAAASDCIGLDCGTPTSPDFVPEAQGPAPAAASVDELMAQSDSGFYEVPALVWRQGEVQPRTVVYLSKPGQFGRMPGSVRNLRLVTHFALRRGSELDSATLVVVDRGILLIVGPHARVAARRRKQARAAQSALDAWADCPDKTFCLWSQDDWEEAEWDIDGPTYVGTGWHNLSSLFNNVANSMVNHRDGDSLLATGTGGDGARYCARENTWDSTFSNNFGNNTASSWALLGSAIDRC
jgi:hypothetical protein